MSLEQWTGDFIQPGHAASQGSESGEDPIDPFRQGQVVGLENILVAAGPALDTESTQVIETASCARVVVPVAGANLIVWHCGLL